MKTTVDANQRGPFVSYDGLLHSGDGTVVYVSRYQDPAYWRDDEVEEDIGYYSRQLGGATDVLDDANPRRDTKRRDCHLG
jgi:hypothetical protein